MMTNFIRNQRSIGGWTVRVVLAACLAIGLVCGAQADETITIGNPDGWTSYSGKTVFSGTTTILVNGDVTLTGNFSVSDSSATLIIQMAEDATRDYCLSNQSYSVRGRLIIRGNSKHRLILAAGQVFTPQFDEDGYLSNLTTVGGTRGDFINCSGGAQLECTDVIIRDYYGGDGSAIRQNGCNSDSRLFFKNCLIERCKSNRGAALFSDKTSDGVIVFDHCEVRHCHTVNSTSSTSCGAIRSYGDTATALCLSNTVIHSNHANYGGGGIYWNAMKGEHCGCTMYECVVSNNYAKYEGGGLMGSSPLYIVGDKDHQTVFCRNYAGTQGGGLCIHLYSGGTAPSNPGVLRKDLGEALVVWGNKAAKGGGLAVAWDEYAYGSGINDVVVSGASFYNNIATQEGGGICVFRSGGGSPTVKMSMESGVVTNNVSEGNGGGISIFNDYSTTDERVTVQMSGGTLLDNTAAKSGGGLYVRQSPLTITNKIDETSGELASLLVARNVAADGGGVCVSNANCTIYGGTMTNNVATTGHGGGICVGSRNTTLSAYPVVKLLGGEVVCNRAELGSGGGASVYQSTLELTGGLVHDNYAKGDGGGFYAFKANVSLTGQVSVVSNHAGGNGGGLAVKFPSYSSSSQQRLTLDGGEVRGNEADGNGGGFWVDGRGSTDSKLEGDIIVRENKATNGGGFYLGQSAYLQVLGGFVFSNEAQSEVVEPEQTAYKPSADARANIKGCGGGFYLQSGYSSGYKTQMRFPEGKDKIGIYLNVASNAADDILSEGYNTSIEYIPTTTNMVLTYAGNAETSGWYEDYFTKDSQYGMGTKVKGADYKDSERYRARLYRGLEGVKCDQEIESKVNNTWNDYLCMTLGFYFTMPQRLWITDHEDVSNGIVNLQFWPVFTNTEAKAEFTSRWAKSAVKDGHLWLAWAGREDDLETVITNRGIGVQTVHTRKLNLRDDDPVKSCDREGRVWVTTALADNGESEPLSNVTNRYYKIFVEKENAQPEPESPTE